MEYFEIWNIFEYGIFLNMEYDRVTQFKIVLRLIFHIEEQKIQPLFNLSHN